MPYFLACDQFGNKLLLRSLLHVYVLLMSLVCGSIPTSQEVIRNSKGGGGSGGSYVLLMSLVCGSIPTSQEVIRNSKGGGGSGGS